MISPPQSSPIGFLNLGETWLHGRWRLVCPMTYRSGTTTCSHQGVYIWQWLRMVAFVVSVYNLSHFNSAVKIRIVNVALSEKRAHKNPRGVSPCSDAVVRNIPMISRYTPSKLVLSLSIYIYIYTHQFLSSGGPPTHPLACFQTMEPDAKWPVDVICRAPGS